MGRVLGHHSKPIAIVNTDGIMDPLIALIEDSISRNSSVTVFATI